MNKTGKATQISDFSYALPVDECVYTISTAQANNLDTLLWQAERENWEYMPQYVGGQKIVPYGNNNRLPVQIRDLMDENNLVRRDCCTAKAPFCAACVSRMAR